MKGQAMPYTPAELQRIIQWLTQHTPRVIEQGCPMCGAPAAGFGVQQTTMPDLDVPLMVIACQTCGYILLFNEAMILGNIARSAP
jgi:hypothetical protein